MFFYFLLSFHQQNFETFGDQRVYYLGLIVNSKPMFHIHLRERYFSHCESDIYLLMSQCLLAKFNRSEMRNPPISRTSIIFSLSHFIYLKIKKRDYKFIAAQNISYKVAVGLINRWKENSFSSCENSIHFFLCGLFWRHLLTSMLLAFTSFINIIICEFQAIYI